MQTNSRGISQQTWRVEIISIHTSSTMQTYQNSPRPLPSPGPNDPAPQTPTSPQKPTLHPLTSPAAPCPRRVRSMPLESFVVVSPSRYMIEWTVVHAPTYGAGSTMVGRLGSLRSTEVT